MGQKQLLSFWDIAREKKITGSEPQLMLFCFLDLKSVCIQKPLFLPHILSKPLLSVENNKHSLHCSLLSIIFFSPSRALWSNLVLSLQRLSYRQGGSARAQPPPLRSESSHGGSKGTVLETQAFKYYPSHPDARLPKKSWNACTALPGWRRWWCCWTAIPLQPSSGGGIILNWNDTLCKGQRRAFKNLASFSSRIHNPGLFSSDRRHKSEPTSSGFLLYYGFT